MTNLQPPPLKVGQRPSPRSRSRRVHLLLAVVAGAVTISAAIATFVEVNHAGATHSVTAAGHVVTAWQATKATGTPSQAAPETATAPADACDVSSFSATSESRLENQTVIIRFALSYRGNSACSISADGPSARLLSTSAAALADGGDQALVTHTPSRLTVRPGDSVSTTATWYQSCGSEPSPLAKTDLQFNGAHAFDPEQPYLSADTTDVGRPRCDPTESQPSAVMTSAPVVGAAGTPQSLTASISALSPVNPGETLHYQITLTDNGPDPVNLTPCPAIQQTLINSSGMPVQYLNTILNCAGTSEIPAHTTATFAMQFALPQATTRGYDIAWGWFQRPTVIADKRAISLNN